MTRTQPKPLVVEEMDAFIGRSIRAATRGLDERPSYGDAGTGRDVDDIIFSVSSQKVLIEFTGDGETETGSVVAYGPVGHQIALDAAHHFTQNFGTPATFQVVLSDQPQPGTYSKNGVTTLLR